MGVRLLVHEQIEESETAMRAALGQIREAVSKLDEALLSDNLDDSFNRKYIAALQERRTMLATAQDQIMRTLVDWA